MRTPMKSWVKGSGAFFLTLAVGTTVAWLLHLDSQPAGTASNVERTEIVSASVQTNDFYPEFRDLPDFASIDSVRPTGKLIDVAESDGLYRESEVIARSGERWLGLFTLYHAHALIYTRTKVARLRTKSYPGDEYDAKLTFDKPRLPLFVIKDIRGIKAGLVNTVYPIDSWLRDTAIEGLESGYRREFNLMNDSFTLRVSTGVTKDATNVAVLVLEFRGVTQVVKQLPHSPTDEKDIIGSLLWAGDLDGDSSPDLYFDEFNEKGYSRTELHLSSHAETGALVKLVATFGTAGC